MTIPYWHPVLVHFPVALLLVAGGAALVWLATGRTFWRQATLALVLLGAVGAFAAKQTGEALEDGVRNDPGFNRSLVHEHEESGEQATIAAVLALAAMAFAEFYARRTPTGETKRRAALAVRVVASLLVVVAAGLVARTGHLGGQATWGVPDGQVAPGASTGDGGGDGEVSTREDRDRH